MGPTEHDIRACILAFNSSNSGEKKKAMDRLRELVNDRSAIQILNLNSERNSAEATDWSTVFHAVYQLLLQETNKIKTEESKGSMTAGIRTRRETWKNDCSSLVVIIVSKANQDIPRIKCYSLLGSVLEILDNEYLRENYADKFIEILRSRVMPFRKYWGEITTELWLSLLETFLSLFKTPPHRAEHSSIVEVLNGVILHGTQQSHLGLKLKRKFPLVAAAFNEPRFYTARILYQEWLLHLSITLCLQLAKESRMATCQFGENVLIPVIRLYDKFSKKKKSMLFDFLLLQMHVHHPQGASQLDGAAYAYNWEQWQKHLQSLYTVVESEIKRVQEIKYGFSKETSLHPVFLQFAVEVCKQVFENSSTVLDVTVLVGDEEATPASSAKRRRVVVGVQAIMDTLRTISDPQYTWPWLSLLSAFMFKYPGSVKEIDFIPLLQLMAELLSACKDSLVMDHLCQCCVALLKVEKHLVANTLDEQTVNPLWEKIWETTLRTVGLNQSEKDSHHLLQTLIAHDKAIRSTELVHMFISGTIKLSMPSLQTLDVLYNTCNVPDTVVPWSVNTSQGVRLVKTALLEWLLPDKAHPNQSEQNVSLVPSVLSKVLIELVLKTRIMTVMDSDICSNESSDLNTILHVIDQDYVLSCFENGLLVPETSKAVTEDAWTNSQNVLVNVANRDRLMELLDRDCDTLIERMGQGGVNLKEVVLEVFSQIALLLEIWSWMLRLKMITTDVKPGFSEKLQNLVENLSSYMIDVIRNIRHEPHSFLVDQMFSKLRQMCEANYHEIVALALREWLLDELLDGVFAVAKTKPVMQADQGDDMMDLDLGMSNRNGAANERSNRSVAVSADSITSSNGYLPLARSEHFTDTQKLQLEAAKVLCSYSSYTGGQKLMKVQNLLTKLLELCISKSLDLNVSSDFSIAVKVLEHLLCAKTLGQSHVALILLVIQAMCRAWHKDTEAVGVILNLLQGSLSLVHNLGEVLDKQNALRLVKGMMKNLNMKKPGPKVCSRFIECLSELAKVDPTASWSMWDSGVKPGLTPAVEDILIHLKSPFHEMRMTAVKSISILFAPSSIDLQWQSRMFDSLCDIVMDLFIVEGELTDEEAVDESANRAASALHTIGSLVVVSPLLRKRALFAMLQLVKEKNLHIELVYKVLTLIGKNLNLQSIDTFMATNLKYLLIHWFKAEHKLQEFPWLLLNCKSESAFYTTYQEVIVPVLLQRDDEEALLGMCQKTGCTVQMLVEACYPRIMACLLPYFSVNAAGDESCGVLVHEVEVAKHNYARLECILTDARIKALLRQHLADLVVEVIRHVHDPTHFSQLCGCNEVMPEPDLPFFNTHVAGRSLEYLQGTSPAPDTHLMVFLCKRLPAYIQHMLLQLGLSIHSAPTRQDKLKAFYQYCTFVNILGSELETNSVDTMSHYIVRDVLHTLIHIVKHSHKNNEIPLAVAACHFLQQFSKKCIPACSNIVTKFLIVIVSVLVPLAKLCDSELGLEALRLLQFFIVENCKSLSSAIKLLDPFPDDSIFQVMQAVYKKIKYEEKKYSLEEEIKHFLNSENVNLGCRTEGLQHLRVQLSLRKPELKMMYDELKNIRGFSEDCANSILHQLICTLVELASISDAGVRLEAARCLGELGPSDLTTTVLRPESKRGMPESNAAGDFLQTFTGHVVRLLAGYLVDEDIRVVEAASTALYVVMACREAQTAVENNLFKPNETLCQEYLVPFINPKKAKKSSHVEVVEERFGMHVDHSNLWCPEDECSHDMWITKLVCSILETFPMDNCFLPQLVPVCKAKVTFSENILPLVVALVLTTSSDSCCEIVWRHVRHFFRQHFTRHARLRREHSTTSTASLKHSEEVCVNKASVQCMLDIVHFVRLQNTTQALIARNDSAVDLNYLHVAQAAQFCSAYFTSILYTELWCDAQMRNASYTEDTFCENITSLEYVCDRNPQDGTVVQNILWEAYMKIGDNDAVYGCGSSHLLDPRTRIRHYELVGKWDKVWDKVMLTYDVQLANGNMDAMRGLLGALQKCSFHHVLSGYIKSLDTELKFNQEDFQFECAWRLAQWDVPATTTPSSTSTFKQSLKTTLFGGEFEKYHFLSLKAMHEVDPSSLVEAVADARCCVIQSLAHASLESSRNLYKALSQLQQIQEIEDFTSAWKLSADSMDLVMKKWKYQDEINFNEFEYVEPILWQRTIMLNVASEREVEQKQQIIDVLANVHLEMAALARNEGYHQVAARSHGAIAQILQQIPNVAVKLKLEEAQLSWERGDREVGKYLLRSLLGSFSTAGHIKEDDLTLYSSALKLYGDWMAETKSENPQIIMNNYFLKALRIMETTGSTKDHSQLLDIYWSLARFADAEYQQLVRYLKSSVYEMKKDWIGKARHDAIKLKQQSCITKDDKRAIMLMEKQSNIDMSEIENTEKEKDMYLTNAMMYYLWGLEHGDKNNLQVFRVASLWLDNMSHKKLNEILKNNLNKVPSYKFVPLLPQLTPRMSNVEDAFITKLNRLLERCAADHPHHTLPLIIALANSYKDRDYINSATSSQNSKSQEPRVLGAQQMVQKLLTNPILGPLVMKMELMSTALISLAYLQVKNPKAESFEVPETEHLHRLKDLDSVLIPTLSIPVKINCRYEDIIGIQKFQSTFSLVGGINAPKKISCIGTDGIARPQLVKGQDDLRQDAVMQQVFTIMNMFLENNKDTSKQKLLIRTYKVVPLSQRSGVIEWCQNTQPLLAYLMGEDRKIGAHKKYYPQDLSPQKCREKFRAVGNKSNQKKLEVYKEICASLHPAFRYFFLEKFPTPGVWYERRLAYIHSVATSSMIGYILGLGDRHTLNILIDNITAEVIHIDFGIAFEMGHILPTPETVPFRLTRDIVDGMGVCGTEGVFRRSCEKTMTVLRQNQATILTILEVLLYDPLYTWTITPNKAYNLQRSSTEVELSEEEDSSVEVNKMAERALLRLQQKLQGVELETATSVAGQVNHLIQQASDPGNLSRLFFGWQPYL